MCGLLGTASTERLKNKRVRSEFMVEGLALDSFRGMESTGIALVSGDADIAPLVHKRALAGFDFIHNPKTQDLLDDLSDYPVVMGHNRASTRGSVSDRNAHPFQFEHITLMHNGTITNTYEWDNIKDCPIEVDSAKVAFSMVKNGEMETLEKCDGGFTFIWWNALTETLNIARNDRKPLYLCYVDKENSMYWASEDTMLAHLLLRRNVAIEDEQLLFPKSNVWHKYQLADLRKVEKVPFALRPNLGRHHGQASSDQLAREIAEWAGYSDREGQTTTGSLIDERSKEIANTKAGKLPRLTGVPTTPKRVDKAKQELHKLGIRYEELRIVSPVNWVAYKNQKRVGVLLGRDRKGGHMVEVPGMHHGEFVKYMQRGMMPCDIVNVRRTQGNSTHLVGILSKKVPQHQKTMQAQEERERVRLSQVDKDVKNSIERTHAGPGGQLITLARFQELCKGNCSNCTGWVNPAYHHSVLWVGSEQNSPICHVCAEDPAILEGLNITIAHQRKAVH